jgi:raffinose/stachyose/melibiose transport system permease protein
VLVPIAYVVLGGFRTTGQIAAKPVGLPHPWVIHNYAQVITSGAFWRQVGNSTIVAAIATALVVGVSALAAYPLSRLQFRGREAIYTFFTFGLLFPVAVAALPLYLLLRQLGLLESLLGVALPEAAFGIPITIIILRPFMRSIPVELEDAAAMDGCRRFGFFWRVLLPLTRPALVTVIVLSVVTSWNNYILPLLVLNDPNHWTLPLGVASYNGEHSADTAGILAFTTLSMLPALIFFMAAERASSAAYPGAVGAIARSPVGDRPVAANFPMARPFGVIWEAALSISKRSSGELGVGCGDVLLQTVCFVVPGIRTIHGFCAREPGSAICAGVVSFRSATRASSRRGAISHPCVGVEARDAVAEVTAGEPVVSSIFRSEPLAQRTEGNEADPELLQRRRDRLRPATRASTRSGARRPAGPRGRDGSSARRSDRQKCLTFPVDQPFTAPASRSERSGRRGAGRGGRSYDLSRWSERSTPA